MSDYHIIAKLEKVLELRRSAVPDQSYVASLYDQGIDKILKKIIEEAGEVVIAAKNHEVHDEIKYEELLVHECADLLFHVLVLLQHQRIPFVDVERELARRFGISGIDEKNARS